MRCKHQLEDCPSCRRAGWAATLEREAALAQQRQLKAQRKAEQLATAKRLHAEGLGNTEIGQRLGVNGNTVATWLRRAG